MAWWNIPIIPFLVEFVVGLVIFEAAVRFIAKGELVLARVGGSLASLLVVGLINAKLVQSDLYVLVIPVIYTALSLRWL